MPTDRVNLLLAYDGGAARRMIDAFRADPASACWPLLCDALEAAGAETGDVCELYAEPPPPADPCGCASAIPATLTVTFSDGPGPRACGPTHTLPAASGPAEDDSLRPLLVAWAETRVSLRLAGRVRAWEVYEYHDGGTAYWWVVASRLASPAEVSDDTHLTPGRAIVMLKRRVLSEFLDAPILGPHAPRRRTRRALKQLRGRTAQNGPDDAADTPVFRACPARRLQIAV